jgi:Fic family protein
MEAASRLIGAYEQIGWTKEAAEILDTLAAAGFTAKAQEPFATPPARIPYTRVESPYAERIRVMWREMRGAIEVEFAGFQGDLEVDETEYLRRVDEVYVNDAYNSLSIEGYQVTPELITKIRDGKWNPDNPEDQKQIDTMAAKGYLEAFKSVKESIRTLFAGRSPGTMLQEDFSRWYRALFSPSVDAGLLSPSDLAGFRRRAVIIRGSMHAPPSYDAVPDCMDAFFAAVREEENAAVRAVLGHFIFTFIHPYVDGNGRLGRFIMNTMFASARMPWTIIRTETRNEYMAALEEASVRGNILPFAHFVKKTIV